MLKRVSLSSPRDHPFLRIANCDLSVSASLFLEEKNRSSQVIGKWRHAAEAASGESWCWPFA
jgi:hypothetical protein